MLLKSVLIFVSVCLGIAGWAQSGTLSVALRGMGEEMLLVADYRGDKSKVVDTLFLDKNGVATNVLNPLLYHKGLYKIMVNYDSFIEFVVDGESVAIIADADDVTGTLRFDESESNQAYLEFLRTHNAFHKKVSLLQKIIDTYPDEKFVKTALTEYKAVKSDFDASIKALSSVKSTFVQSLALARVEPAPDLNLPSEKRTEKILSEFFEKIDLKDTNLFYSDAYTQKAIGYISMKVSSASQAEQVESFKTSVDDILLKMSVNKKAYDVVTDYMISGFESMQLTELVNYITDKYIEEQGCNDGDRSSTLHRKVRYHSNMKVGDEVYSFTASTLKKGKISLKDFTDKPLVLTFWASWCPHCTKEMPQISELFNEQKERKFELAMVSLDTVRSDLDEFLKANKMTKQFNLCDQKAWDGELVEKYNVFSTPTIFVIQAGKILAKPENYAELREFLASENLVAW